MTDGRLIDCIMTRRSVRAFSGRQLPQDTIETLLRAGMAAPSAMNRQPWRFVVVRERETLEAVTKFHPYSSMLPGAGQALFLCADTHDGALPGYFQQDMGACAQNILLCAHAMGLGAVWLGVYPRADRCEPIAKLLRLPENLTPFCIIAVGEPAEHPAPQDRYDAQKIRYESWEE